MPEFVLDHGTQEASKRFAACDSFTQGYIEAMFFTNTGSSDDGELESATVDDLSEKAWQEILEDCAAFQETNRADLDEALDIGRVDAYDEWRAGNDFWYTRCGHGVGFWDRDLGDVGERLSDAAHKFGNVDLYCGDDGRIYF
jgi:hypothetical protein